MPGEGASARTGARDDQASRRLDQREVREGLREVPEVPPGGCIELLRVEAERRRDAQQTLHQVASPLGLTDDRQGRHEPERTDQERPLLPGEAVVGLAGAIAEDVAILG